MSERIWYLKRADLFQSMSVEELELLESRCRAKSFPRGSVIYAPQDEADGVLLLAAGRAKVYTITDDGKQAILAFIEPGEVFGELAVVDQEDREDYAEALENATVVLIPKQAIMDLMDTRPQVGLAITKLMGLRRRRLERRLKSLMFRSTRDRLIHALLEFAEEYGDVTEEGIALRIRLSHQDLANLIRKVVSHISVLRTDLSSSRKMTKTRIEHGTRIEHDCENQFVRRSRHHGQTLVGPTLRRLPRSAGRRPHGHDDRPLPVSRRSTSRASPLDACASFYGPGRRLSSQPARIEYATNTDH